MTLVQPTLCCVECLLFVEVAVDPISQLVSFQSLSAHQWFIRTSTISSPANGRSLVRIGTTSYPLSRSRRPKAAGALQSWSYSWRDTWTTARWSCLGRSLHLKNASSISACVPVKVRSWSSGPPWCQPSVRRCRAACNSQEANKNRKRLLPLIVLAVAGRQLD